MENAERIHERCGCAAALSGPFALAGTERKYERSRPFLVRHTFIDLKLDFASRSLTATARLELSRVAPDADAIELDAIGFEIQEVTLSAGRTGGKRASFDYDGEVLRIVGLAELAEPVLEIRYRAVPRRGLYFLAPDAKVRSRPVQVWTQCQDEDARHWFPCHDKPHVKMTTELRVTVPNGFVALSNGEPVEASETKSKTKAKAKVRKRAKSANVFHFRLDKPHPSYLVTLVVGRFSIVADRDAKLPDGRKIPVRYYVPTARKADAARSFGETPRMIELFSRVTGVPFPWSRYSQVVVNDFVFGGMENTTATTMYEHVLIDRRAELDISSNDLVAHELAHQWFGDFVTCRDWSQAWLNEGFATYFEHVEREDRLGRDEYDYGIQGDLETYLGEAGSRYQRAIVCRDYQEPLDLFDRHLYEKGGLVLHLLRRELGDALFWQGVKNYLAAHAYALVETVNLQRTLEEVSGRSLERFFDQWVYRPGHPELKVKVGYEDGLLTVSVKQSQKGHDVATFEFDLEIEVRSKQGEVSRHRKRVSGSHDALVVALPRRPAYVGFDPESRVLGSITVEAPADMLHEQLAQGSSAKLRWSAARGLAQKADPVSLKALAAGLDDEGAPWMVRAECARALGKARSATARELLIERIAIEHPKVRRAVAAALGAFRDAPAASALARLARRDRSYLVEAEAARSLGKTRQSGVTKLLVEKLRQASWGEVVRSGALDGLAALRDEGALDAVTEQTRYGHPTRSRRSAIAALGELGEGKRAREHLESLLDDADPHVRSEVASALARLGDQRGRAALRRALEQEHDGRVVRRIREVLRDMGDGAAERKRLHDELESVRGELADLKTRLSKLEDPPRAGAPSRSHAVSQKRTASSKRRGPRGKRTTKRASS